MISTPSGGDVRPARAPSGVGRIRGDFVRAESAAALSDLWEMLSAPFVPASPDQLTHAGHKARQLAVAGRLGFELPPTMITNDPDRFLDFHRRHHGDLITKRIGTGQRLAAADDETIIRYADPVRPRDLVHVQDVALCPFVAQARVSKSVELRVTVVGDHVFAAAIHSQAAHHTRLDWRRYDAARTPMTAVDLPADVAERCRTLTGALGLRYGAIDLVLTPEGRYVFLEINPNGQYLWIEEETGLPITRRSPTCSSPRRRPPPGPFDWSTPDDAHCVRAETARPDVAPRRSGSPGAGNPAGCDRLPGPEPPPADEPGRGGRRASGAADRSDHRRRGLRRTPEPRGPDPRGGRPTVSVAVSDPVGLPWPLRGVARAREYDLLRVNETTMTVQEAMACIDGMFDDRHLLRSLIDACLIGEAIDRAGLVVTDQDIRSAAATFRRRHGLRTVRRRAIGWPIEACRTSSSAT